MPFVVPQNQYNRNSNTLSQCLCCVQISEETEEYERKIILNLGE